MATNKNALIRYKVLDQCFRNLGKRYFIDDLIEACNDVLLEIDPTSDGISLRQIRDDIAFMKSKEGWRIELGDYKDGKRMFYRYKDPQFSINNMPLNEMELNQLQTAMEILSQFKGMPQFEWVNELIPKLKQGLAYTEQSAVIMEFESNQYLKGIEHLGVLYNAIFYKRVLKVEYQPFESETGFDFTIHPYYLKQYNNRWFLFGYNPALQRYNWNLAIDRIVSVQEVKQRFHPNTEIDWSEYFEDMIGVTKPDEARTEEVVLIFKGKTAKYMETKPLHGSQRSKWVDGELEVHLNLIVNYELERLILSYADSVIVKKPDSLIGVISKRLEVASTQYLSAKSSTKRVVSQAKE